MSFLFQVACLLPSRYESQHNTASLVGKKNLPLGSVAASKSSRKSTFVKLSTLSATECPSGSDPV